MPPNFPHLDSLSHPTKENNETPFLDRLNSKTQIQVQSVHEYQPVSRRPIGME